MAIGDLVSKRGNMYNILWYILNIKLLYNLYKLEDVELGGQIVC